MPFIFGQVVARLASPGKTPSRLHFLEHRWTKHHVAAQPIAYEGGPIVPLRMVHLRDANGNRFPDELEADGVEDPVPLLLD